MMYDLIKSLAAQLLMPLPVSIGFLVFGFLLIIGKRQQLSAIFCGVGLVVLFLTSWAPVAERLLLPLETRYSALAELPQDSLPVAVVVLGGGWQPEAPISSVSRLDESSALRLMEGIRLWRQAPKLLLIVTGASSNSKIAPVALGYAEAAQALGVPAQQVQVLDWPTDTGQEAKAVRQLLGASAQVILVTSASHMPRAMLHFQAAGLVPLAAPTHYLVQYNSPRNLGYWIPSASYMKMSERTIYETLGMFLVNVEH